MKTKDDLKIKKSGMSNVAPSQKHAFLMILSFLGFEDLVVVAQVCKTFFFMLKDEEKFWKAFVDKNFGVERLLEGENSWKEYCLSSLRCSWDESKFGDYFKADETRKVVTNKGKSGWNAAISKFHLREGVLCGLEFVQINK